ncbi:MAG: hypothetical protein IMZ55_12490, partial [Acidobacteria bacterium]|nr:hypothetical protein [Acidobacteriota bacterium]
LAGVQGLSAETAGAVASAARRPDTVAARWDAGVSAVRQWLFANLGAPVQAFIERVFQWMREALDAIESVVQKRQPAVTPPGPPASKAVRVTEPSGAAVRLT